MCIYDTLYLINGSCEANIFAQLCLFVYVPFKLNECKTFKILPYRLLDYNSVQLNAIKYNITCAVFNNVGKTKYNSIIHLFIGYGANDAQMNNHRAPFLFSCFKSSLKFTTFAHNECILTTMRCIHRKMLHKIQRTKSSYFYDVPSQKAYDELSVVAPFYVRLKSIFAIP